MSPLQFTLFLIKQMSDHSCYVLFLGLKFLTLGYSTIRDFILGLVLACVLVSETGSLCVSGRLGMLSLAGWP